MREGLPPGRLVACGLLIMASWLPWFSLGVVQSLGELYIYQSSPSPEVGWFGTLGIWEFTLPNWFVAVAALFVALLALMAMTPNTVVPRWLPLAFAAYAFLHLVCIVLVAQLGKPSSGSPIALGEGWWLAFLASLCVLFSLLRKRMKPVPLKSPEEV